MENKNLLEQYKKIEEMNLDYQEKMALSLQFLDDNCLHNLYEGRLLTTRLIEEAEENKDHPSLAKLLSKKGWLEIELGKPLAAHKSLHKALDVYLELDDTKGIMSTYSLLGFNNSRLGNPEEGFKCHEKALKIALELNNPTHMVPIYNRLAGNLVDLKRYQEALFYYEKALSHGPQLYSETIIQKGMGYVYYLLGDNEKAIHHYNEAFRLANEGNLEYYKSGTLIRLAAVYQKLGRYDEAQTSCLKALEYGQENKLPRVEMNALFSLSKLHSEQNQLDKALEYLKKAYKKALIAKIIPSQISILEETWNILARSFKWEEALNYIKKHHQKYLDFHNQEILKIIDRFKMEEAIKEKKFYQEMHNRLVTISTIGKELTASLEIDTITEIIFRQIQSFMDTALFGLGLYDEERATIEYQLFSKGQKWLKSYHLDIEDKNSLAAWCLRNKKEILINNLEKEYLNYTSDLSRLKLINKDVKSLIYTPLLVGTKVIGILFVHSYQKDAYMDYQVELLKALSAYVVIAFENARFFKQAKYLAITDPLTGLYNRRYFFELTARELERYKRYDEKFSLIMLDLDNFKKINDLYGHASGDLVLKEIARFLTKNLRRTDILCRYGGEEFIMLLIDLPLEGAISKANSLREGLSNLTIELSTGEIIQINGSFGVTEVLKEDHILDSIIKRADLALYDAKEKGKNRVSSLTKDISEIP